MIIYTTKLPLPIGSDPDKLSQLGLCKAFGLIFPLSEGGDVENAALIAQFVKAQKHEKKLRKACELAFTNGKQAFKKKVKTYLSDKRCLLVALFEDNARQKLRHRKSLEQLITLPNQYDILKCLNEPAKISIRPKSSGFGTRQITSFGPVARAAQHMVVTMLRVTYQPQEFQFTNLGSAQKIQMAMSLITKKGYSHSLEDDIVQYYPSFSEEELLVALPLPTEAIKQIVLAKDAQWAPAAGNTTHTSYIPTPLGIPQGSACSSEVAHWCIAHMKIGKVEGAQIINHADNFFIFAVSKEAMVHVSKALSTGIAGLPGGDFTGDIKQSGRIADGFRMLGCWVSVEKGGLIANPTDANLQHLRGRTYIEAQRIHAKLTQAKIEGSDKLRINDLQDYLRLECFVRGWINAFKFCGPQISCIEDDLVWKLDVVREIHEITAEELKPLNDASTVVNINWYSGQ